MPLLLASESPRRKHLLAQLTDDLQIEAAQVEELTAAADMSPVQVAMYNAALKADAAAAKHKKCWVLGADTIVVMDGRVYGKPADLAEAREFLQKFSGRTHEVVTAVALRRAEDNASYDFTAVSHVRFRQLSDEVINEYLSLTMFFQPIALQLTALSIAEIKLELLSYQRIASLSSLPRAGCHFEPFLL